MQSWRPISEFANSKRIALPSGGVISLKQRVFSNGEGALCGPEVLQLTFRSVFSSVLLYQLFVCRCDIRGFYAFASSFARPPHQHASCTVCVFVCVAARFVLDGSCNWHGSWRARKVDCRFRSICSRVPVSFSLIEGGKAHLWFFFIFPQVCCVGSDLDFWGDRGCGDCARGAVQVARGARDGHHV